MNEKPVLAIDGGGSGFRKAIVSGTRISHLSESGKIENVEELMQFIGRDLPDICGIAYAVAGVIKARRKIIKSPNIPFLNGVDLADETEETTGKQSIVLNDMEAAVIGMKEMFPFLEYFLGITWSSGIGLRIFKDGKILTDSEGGHMVLDRSASAPLCGCGNRGCVEAFLGAKALTQKILKILNELQISIPKQENPCAFLDFCWDKKISWAVDLYDSVAYDMACFLASLVNLLHLPAIVWKGVFAKGALPRIESLIREYMKSHLINPTWESEMKFYYSWEKAESIKDADALIGAAKVFSSIS